MKPCRISFCGAGKWVRAFHIPMLEQRADRFAIRGFYDVFQENAVASAAGKYHVFSSMEELLQDDETDVVLVATKPVDTHYEATMRLLEAGRNVILEKPMTYSSEQCDALIAKAKEKGVLFTVNHNLRCSVCLKATKEVIRQGHVGEAVNVEITSPRSWYDQIDFSNYAVHMIDQALAINRSPLKEVMACTAHRNDPMSSCGYGAALLVFEKLPSITVSLLPLPMKQAIADEHPYRGYFRFRVTGTKDSFAIADLSHIPAAEQLLCRSSYYFDNAEPDFTRPEFVQSLDKAWYDFFYESWAGGAPLLVSPEEARNNIRCAELITESSRLNRAVDATNMLPIRKECLI
ncbi:MAG: Gfo/Idh/MocA family oxidoreductase [Victivallales bacterium]|nr:Gfo/Idh/MocA family oxidoreductase [Victivallales bacterium]